jgi:hypothetical protein
MFNEYSVFQIMKLRQEEIERTSKDAWKHFVPDSEEINLHNKTTVYPCCQSACA